MKRNKRMLTKYISYCLCGLLLCCPALSAEAGEAAVSYEQLRAGAANVGDKERDYTVISISTAEELQELAENCTVDAWSVDKYIKLENDILLSGETEIVIPSFGGLFDGCGHRISGLTLHNTGSAAGLFRYIQEGAAVQNLTVAGRVLPEGSQSEVGILAGVNYGRITNCRAEGTVEGDTDVGGLVGVNGHTGEIRNCSSGAVVSGNHSTGGICGSNLGILNHCTNQGSVNIYTTEVTYELDDFTMENLEDMNSASNVAVHTDTGGVTGYSEGKLYYCSNAGKVGYQHVGYNVGGVVGRLHQGYVQNCTNTGQVFGRKDVGGIVGQMEPFLEIQYLDDKLKEIDREADKLIDLLDETQKDLSGYGKQASELTKSLTVSLRNISGAAENLTNTTNDLWYIYNQELTGVGNDLDRLGTDLENQGNADKENGGTKDITVSGGDFFGSISGGDAGDITITVPTVPDDTESYRAALRRFGDSAGTHLSNITTATGDRSGGIKDNLNVLNSEMKAACDTMSRLADVLQQGTDENAANMDAVVAQTRVLRQSVSELRDDLFRYEGITVEDASDEAASGELINPGAEQEEARYDTSSFQQGKVTLCVNEGSVEADTNVGGIVGQVATEYDFDPEDDIEVTGAESFHIEQTVKAVVRESRNLGTVTGKKDYIGGIVGKADFGAIISCESYGSVSSTGGSYVGGIAGSSGYAVRSCYAMGELSGKNYVGGIAGKGSDVFYSYAYPSLEMTGECGGSIAGQVADDGILYGNYYVAGNIPGVDSIGYAGGAEPLPYEEFCSREGVPAAFSQFTVTFLADGVELASFQCSYGDSLDSSQIPQIPQKEGYYGEWPAFDHTCITRNMVLEAQYEKWISSLAGSEKAESGKTRFLVQGQFLPEAELRVSEEEDNITLSVVYVDESGEETGAYEGPLLVRVFCEDTEKTLVEICQDGVYTQALTETVGSYLEFTLEGRVFRLTQASDGNKLRIVAAAAAAGVALLLVLLVRNKNKRKKAKKTERK